MFQNHPNTEASITMYSYVDFIELIQSLESKEYWTNGVSLLGINYKNDKTIDSISVCGRDTRTGDEFVELLSVKLFIEFLSRVKDLNIEENKDKAVEINKTFDDFVSKISK